jgi:UDP-N-acetylmuramoyl-L-alanyl-D-glutamate--2,6-diaminopimelate ligase
MGQIASRLADTVIVTSDNSRSESNEDIIDEILRGIDKEKQYTVIVDRREAIRKAVLEYVRRGDVLILAGKGHETYQIDGEGKHRFDEREIVKEALCELYDRK